jgi:hypothetical protein
MALLPPSPLGQPPGNTFWNDWYEKLRTLVNGSTTDLTALQAQVTQLSGQPYVTTTASSSLSSEWVLTAGSNVTIDTSTPHVVVISSTSSANVTPDTHPVTPNQADDEFEYGTSIDTSGARFSGASPWSWYNQGSSTATVTQGQLVLTIPGGPAITGPTRAVEQSVSGSSWKYRAKLCSLTLDMSNYAGVLMQVRNSSIDYAIILQKNYSSGMQMELNRQAAGIYFSNIAVVPAFTSVNPGRSSLAPMYFEIELSSGVLYFRYSDTGADGTFILAGQDVVSSYIVTPDRIGLGCASYNSQPVTAVWDWFRKIS